MAMDIQEVHVHKYMCIALHFIIFVLSCKCLSYNASRVQWWQEVMEGVFVFVIKTNFPKAKNHSAVLGKFKVVGA